MEETGNCKMFGNSDMFHLALFFPTFRVRRNADVVEL
jgi:hypothetical protein